MTKCTHLEGPITKAKVGSFKKTENTNLKVFGGDSLLDTSILYFVQKDSPPGSLKSVWGIFFMSRSLILERLIGRQHK